MRKFIVHTRPITGTHTSGVPVVVEVEGEMIAGIEDPSIMWLPQGEFRFRITQPNFLYEPQEVRRPGGIKEKVMVPPVYHSHAVYWTTHQAHVAAEHMVRHSFEFIKRKTGVDFTEQQVKEKCKEITEILL
jgi:hypothetical protein